VDGVEFDSRGQGVPLVTWFGAGHLDGHRRALAIRSISVSSSIVEVIGRGQG
jgi:hypothetical protein